VYEVVLLQHMALVTPGLKIVSLHCMSNLFGPEWTLYVLESL